MRVCAIHVFEMIKVGQIDFIPVSIILLHADKEIHIIRAQEIVKGQIRTQRISLHRGVEGIIECDPGG
jgi:hypothetical protein